MNMCADTIWSINHVTASLIAIAVRYFIAVSRDKEFLPVSGEAWFITCLELQSVVDERYLVLRV